MMGENNVYVGQLYSSDGTGWVKIGDVKDFDLSKTDIDPETALNDDSEYLKLYRQTEMTFTIKLKTKHNRKTFKKWLMSRGVSRDFANWMCQVIGLFKGKVSYETVYLYILAGGTI